MMSPSIDSSPLATATAPAKMILLGEHAVVYDRPALAVPVWGVTAQATVFPSNEMFTISSTATDGGATIEFEQALVLRDAPPDDPLATAARETIAHVGLAEPPNWHVEVRSTIPVSGGMGSSAAVAVAVIRALALAAGSELDADTVSRLAFKAERCAHGTPSGIDNAVVAYQQPIRFQGGSTLAVAVRTPLRFVVADSGPSAPTRETVAAVRRLREERPDVCRSWFDQIGQLVDDGVAAMEAAEPTVLGRAMNANHLLLQALRVSTPALDQLVASARGAGALGAKLSGAGRGGIVAALVDDTTSAQVEDALVAAGARRVTTAEVAAMAPAKETL